MTKASDWSRVLQYMGWQIDEEARIAASGRTGNTKGELIGFLLCHVLPGKRSVRSFVGRFDVKTPK
jgi:hypothetical protein